MRAPAAVFALVVAASSIDPGGAAFTAFTVFATFAASASQVPQPAQPGQPAPGQPAPGQQTPPRGVLPRPGEQVPAGTAILRGQVTSTDGTPLRRAQVRAISQDGRPSSGTSSTDAQGKFEIKEVAAGRYTISASKAGFVTMQFGQRRADQMGGGTVLAVLDGQLVEKIGFSLPRGGVVTGRIIDEFGEPIAGVQVSAVRSRYMNGQRRMMPRELRQHRRSGKLSHLRSRARRVLRAGHDTAANDGDDVRDERDER